MNPGLNTRLHAGAVGLGCLGVLLIFAGWLGLRTPVTLHCGDETCEEAHP